MERLRIGAPLLRQQAPVAVDVAGDLPHVRVVSVPAQGFRGLSDLRVRLNFTC